jgi:calcineurin-like phosphoesterase family protein
MVKVLIPTDDGGNMTSLDEVKNAIFLAGPCPREDYENADKWRKDAIDILNDIGFDGYVLNPTNKNYLKMRNLEKQTTWEQTAMSIASAIVFWCDRTEKLPGFTTNYEIGAWMKKPRIYIGIPEDVKKKNANAYIAVKAEAEGKKVYPTLKELLLDVTYDLEQKGKTYFTSDTHFGSDRAREFSRRPFRTVEEMDLELISNWNKTVRPNDDVYFLGDFGDAKRIKCLNGNIHFIEGNYERDGKSEKPEGMETFKNDDLTVKGKDSFVYYLRHEPVNPLKEDEGESDRFYLFGHIHEKNRYKSNGINVGTDLYNFTPVELAEIDWMRNAVLNHLDENVFVESCR